MAKTLTNDLRHVDVRRLARDGLLVPGNTFAWNWNHDGKVITSIGLIVGRDEATFSYTFGSQKLEVKQRVALQTTPCTYGRSRQWFSCPHCYKRVALLYIGQQVACRLCNGMAYRVQRESAHDRQIRRLGVIRDRLGWEPGFLNGHGGKKKGMHLRTYCQLVVDHDELALAVMRRMLKRAERQQERIARVLAEHPEWDIPNFCEITS